MAILQVLESFIPESGTGYSFVGCQVRMMPWMVTDITSDCRLTTGCEYTVRKSHLGDWLKERYCCRKALFVARVTAARSFAVQRGTSYLDGVSFVSRGPLPVVEEIVFFVDGELASSGSGTYVCWWPGMWLGRPQSRIGNMAIVMFDVFRRTPEKTPCRQWRIGQQSATDSPVLVSRPSVICFTESETFWGLG